ncbi:MAG: hypothetical protein EA360_08690 [Balneolaceae bacterium]|nr:MAG: hypothetical protein EA360_08690 [Balneolaceae bacterium]
MNKTLFIQEKYSSYWPLIAIISFFLAIVLFIIYLFTDTAILEGILRLAAFIFFATGILTLLKINQGQISVITTVSENREISISYQKKGREAETYFVPASSVAELKIDEMPNRSLYNDIIKSDRCIRIRRTDSSEWEYLYKTDARVIPFSEENAKKLYSFLKKHL